MSKAFTSEETPDPGPVVRAAPRLAPGEVRYVTPEGAAALRSRLAGARAAGGSTPGPQVALLEATLAALTVLGPEAAPEGEVAFARWVTVEDDAGRSSAWRIVGPDEVDPRRGLISVHSPVARALLRRRAGDEAELPRPEGTRRVRVVAVSAERPLP
ncbi:MAG: GreA/GreB family elongation factor [Deltaproteobacteria bacterium]|nr:GreA/GreB family elongation factor [Deltaproteobacteria bacterium]